MAGIMLFWGKWIQIHRHLHLLLDWCPGSCGHIHIRVLSSHYCGQRQSSLALTLRQSTQGSLWLNFPALGPVPERTGGSVCVWHVVTLYLALCSTLGVAALVRQRRSPACRGSCHLLHRHLKCTALFSRGRHDWKYITQIYHMFFRKPPLMIILTHFLSAEF